MHTQHDDKQDERIRFLAKHYEEGRFDTEGAWKRFAAGRGIRPRVPYRRYLLAAASVAILIAVTGTLSYLKNNSPEWVILSSTPGKTKDVYLPDSSLVSLAGGAEIRYDAKKYGKNGRDVMLTGKAFFEVEHDESRPFSIQTKLAEVVVLGTSFQVDGQPTSVDVTVATGKVLMTAGEGDEKKNVTLTAGMSANYSMETQQIELITEEKLNYLSWKTGQLRFENTPLEEVIEDLSEYYKVPVRSRMMIRGEKLTATFNQIPLDQVILIINQTLDVRLVAGKSN